MVAATGHALERVNGRLAEAGVRVTPQHIARLDAHAQGETSAAFLLFVLPEHRGDVNGGMDRASNGDQVWAIVRNRRVVTVMFRRSTQRQDPGAFYVDTVHHQPMFEVR